MRRWLAATLLLGTPGCGACSDHGASVGGPHPYVRCVAVDEPDGREGRIGAMRFVVEDRTVSLEADASSVRIAAFRGPGRTAAPIAPALAGLGPESTDLLIVVGGLGSTETAVMAVLEAVGSVGVPAIVLPGGEDDAEAVEAGFDALEGEARERVFDGRRLRLVRVGRDELVLVPGAPAGRYAADSGACGISEDDLESIADDVGETEEGRRRWLVSWATPSGRGEFGAARGFGGVDSGDRRIAELAEAVGAAGGLFAFPETRALLPATADGSRPLALGEASAAARLVLPTVAGAPVERDDGTLIPTAPALVTLGPDGLTTVGTHRVVNALVPGAATAGDRALTAPGPPL